MCIQMETEKSYAANVIKFNIIRYWKFIWNGFLIKFQRTIIIIITYYRYSLME